jgi:hypothetical protein
VDVLRTPVGAAILAALEVLVGILQVHLTRYVLPAPPTLSFLRRRASTKFDILKLSSAPYSFVRRHCALFVVLTGLCGCSASQAIGLYTADYRDTTATAGDAQLLLNILRAKDNLPIHFYDLSIIHGSLQWTAGAAANIPFALNGSATAGTVSPAFSLQTAPTFDVGTSDTQEFTRGILSPLDPRVVKALFDQGVDPRIMMLLFFSAYREPSGRILLNTTACDPSWLGRHPERGCYNQIYDYLDKIDRLLATARIRAGISPHLQAKIRANIFYALQPIGGRLAGAWALSNLSDLRQFDIDHYRLVDNRLYSISEPRLAICYEHGGTLSSLIPVQYPDAACTRKQVIVAPTRTDVGLSVRSTYDIIQFLGQILKYQEEEPKNRCLTLDTNDETCSSGKVLFQVNAPTGIPVIATKYADRWFALYDRGCNEKWREACDYSVEVLAILEILINENKSAKDIIATPRVQVVQ